jgi:hypothetical protein
MPTFEITKRRGLKRDEEPESGNRVPVPSYMLMQYKETD